MKLLPIAVLFLTTAVFAADPEGFAALLAERGVTALPNPEIKTPSWFGQRTDTDVV